MLTKQYPTNDYLTINSPHFHAVLDDRRQFFLKNNKPIDRILTRSREGAHANGIVGYVREYLPDRLPLLKGRLKLLELCDNFTGGHTPSVLQRYNQITCLATVGHIIKILKPYPETYFLLRCPHNSSVGKVVLSAQLDSKSEWLDVIVKITPEEFKVDTVQELRKFNLIFQWICCLRLNAYANTFVCGADLKILADDTQLSLVSSYKKDPIKFTLISQCARLLMP